MPPEYKSPAPHGEAAKSDDAYDLVQTLGEGPYFDVRVALTERDGVTYVDIRLFAYIGEDGWVPTQKGITLPLTDLAPLIKALEAAEERAERRGLIGGR